MLGSFPSLDPFSRVQSLLLKTFTSDYLAVPFCDYEWFLHSSIFEYHSHFYNSKKIYSDNARGFLLVAPHLLQYIGEDKKVLPFSPLFSRIYRRERKKYIFLFLPPHSFWKLVFSWSVFYARIISLLKRADHLGLKEYHLSTSFAGRFSASKIRFFLRLSFSAYRPAKIFLYSNFL